MYKTLILVVTIISSTFATALSIAEEISMPLLDGARTGDVVVTGQAKASSVPITIYDLSYPARTALGRGTSMDNNGYFAVLVSPPLIEGHEIIAEDKYGHTSLPVVVTTPDPLTDSVH